MAPTKICNTDSSNQLVHTFFFFENYLQMNKLQKHLTCYGHTGNCINKQSPGQTSSLKSKFNTYNTLVRTIMFIIRYPHEYQNQILCIYIQVDIIIKRVWRVIVRLRWSSIHSRAIHNGISTFHKKIIEFWPTILVIIKTYVFYRSPYEIYQRFNTYAYIPQSSD